VTSKNKKQFVRKYIDWFFNRSIEDNFKEFYAGFVCFSLSETYFNTYGGLSLCRFHTVGGNLISMFQPEELRILIVGGDDLDFALLKKNCQYDGGYKYVIII
jgi:hypothetical protein